ncbi:methionyl-tRNA formyltransferase [Pseudomonas sp. F1_0610]|uniref:methionyl-tRNA formyltransferase n=1 Tax=Pseudomonas sp. F1_0610 TaxID=3114284 RepID=UPI0039C49836
MSPSLRIIFAGTPEFAAKHLQALLASQHEVIAVYTQPDRPAGRGQKLLPSPVKALALENTIPVYQPVSLKGIEAQQQLAALNADLMVVVAYGLLLPQAVLDAPRLGCINSHASLLPRWRGAAPIQRAIEAGDTETGVTVMQMEAGLDTGPMLLKVTTPISQQDTASTVHDRLAELGAQAVINTANQLAQGSLSGEMQDDALSCYASKLIKTEAVIDWSLPAQVLDRKIRGLHPWLICHTRIEQQQLKIHSAEVCAQTGRPGEIISIEKEAIVVACGEQALRITRVQLPNAKALSVSDVLNGKKELFKLHQVLGQ